jgi:hypothetical protein
VVARLEARHPATDRLHLAGAFQAQPGRHAADPAVLTAGRDHEIGAIEARGAHPDQDFVGGGRGLWQIAKLDPGLSQNGSSHGGSSGLGATYTLPWGIHCNGGSDAAFSHRWGFSSPRHRPVMNLRHPTRLSDAPNWSRMPPNTGQPR